MDRATWFKDASISGQKISRFKILRDALGTIPVVVSSAGKTVVIANTEENRDEIEVYEAAGPKDAPASGMRLKIKGGTFTTSNNIQKSPMFGGFFNADKTRAETLSFTESTARAESLQCFYNAAIAQNPRLQYKNISKAVLQKTANKCKTGSTTLAQAYSMDVSWHQSSYWIAQALVKGKYINSTYTYHRDDTIMKSIYAAKGRAYTKNKISILRDDKWNPGDFWAVKQGVNVASEFKDHETSVEAINKKTERLFNDKKVIGISLKKVNKENKLKIKRLNHSEDPREVKAHQLSHVELAGKKGFFSAKQAYVYTRTGIKAVLADKSGNVGPQAIEIVLTSAKGGQAGFDIAIIPAAERHLGAHNIANNKTAVNITGAIEQGDVKTINKFWKMVETVQKSPLCKDRLEDKVNEAEFKQQLKATTKDRIHSKYAQASILNALVKANGSNQDSWIDWVINYAGSTLAESSVYLKAFQES